MTIQEVDLFFKTLLDWCLDLGPALVLGLIISGILFVFIGDNQTSLFNKILSIPEDTRKKSFLNSLKVALIGVPMPLCSCSVLPVAQTLRKKGLSQSTVSAFLTTTPETSPASFLLTWVLIGPAMAILRPIASLIMGITTSMVIAFGGRIPSGASDNSAPLECCGDHCLAMATEETPRENSWTEKFKKGFKFAFVDLLDDFGYWPLLGLALGAAIFVWVPVGALENASSFWGRLGIIIISIPIYVCAESSTPLAPGLLLKGLSPGAIFLFLIAGPLTNLASMLSLKKAFGTRFIVLHAGGNSLIALLLSYLVDMLYKYFSWTVTAQETIPGEHSERSTFLLLVGVIGTGLLISSSLRAIKKKFSKHNHSQNKCCD